MTGSSNGNGHRPEALRLEGLRMYYDTPQGAVKAVDDVSFTLYAGERFGLAGESGSGKSSMALTIMRLLKPPARIVSGKVWLDGTDLLTLSEEEMRKRRLAAISMVAQGSMNSLNPVTRVRDMMRDAFTNHDIKLNKAELEERIRSLLAEVGLRPEVADMFPHELSGGMKQRVIIAIAISLGPKVIIADEPTSALDVVVQRHVMQTLRKVQADIGASVILVGHDMGLMAQFVERLGIMYAGRLIEVSRVREIFKKPRHPYTQLLISSLPSKKAKGEFHGIPGLPPSLLSLPPGCPFHPRCPYAIDRCQSEVPAMREVQPDTWAACHLA